MKYTDSLCLKCTKPFKALTSEIKRGHGKFCSPSCSASYNIKKRYDKINIPNVCCSYCGKIFYKNPSKIKNSKHSIFFCCRKHKDLAQRIGGIEAIQPPQYNSHSSTYRDFAMRSLPNKCNCCNYDKNTSLLQVHHKDKNRRNNELNNLEILCILCHGLKHLNIVNSKELIMSLLTYHLKNFN